MLDSTAINSNQAVYIALQDLCANNQEYFKKDDDESSQRLSQGFAALLDHVRAIMPLLDEFRYTVNIYDYDKDTAANGYRSFIMVADTFVTLSVRISKEICLNRGTLFFKKSRYVKDVEVSAQVFSSLISCLELLKFIRSSTTPSNSLFLTEPSKIKEALKYIDRVNLYCFFGRFVGFQFPEAVQHIVKSVSVMMAAFGSVYFGEENNIFSLTSNCSTMLMDAEARANQIVQISNYRTASVHFCKTFWNLSELELFKLVPNLLHSRSGVNELYTVTFQPIQCISSDGVPIDIPVPSSHISRDSIPIRLISSKKRVGMQELANGKKEPLSEYVIFHCHGGGFVAQTSGSHLTYLKDWSHWLDVPIVSVDYSLAPEAPYPRALEEVMYAYAWLLNNASLVGTTGQKIIFAGDSAGANLCLALALKCIDTNMRLPDGIFLAYLPVMMSVTPTPSRMLCLMDPLMPFGFMVGCIKAYTYPLLKRHTSTDQQQQQQPIGERECKESEKYSPAAILDQIENINLETDAAAGSSTIGSSSVSLQLDADSEDKVIYDINANTEEEEEDTFSLPTKFKKATENFAKSFHDKMKNIKNAGKFLRREEMMFINEAYAERTVERLIEEVAEDAYLSPYLASEESLKKLPPLSILSVQLDPCLDDCVMLAKKINSIGGRVRFNVLDGLPHGFLNLSMLSKEAHAGSRFCSQLIRDLFSAANN